MTVRSEGGRAATFGDLLVRFRRAAGLTQDGLAEASGMSVRALRDMEASVERERAVHAAHQQVVELTGTQRMAVAFFKEGIGHCLVAMGESRLAAEMFRETRQMRIELGSPGNVALPAFSEGQAWQAAGEYARARECFEYALETYGDQASPHRRAQILAELAKLPGE